MWVFGEIVVSTLSLKAATLGRLAWVEWRKTKWTVSDSQWAVPCRELNGASSTHSARWDPPVDLSKKLNIFVLFQSNRVVLSIHGREKFIVFFQKKKLRNTVLNYCHWSHSCIFTFYSSPWMLFRLHFILHSSFRTNIWLRKNCPLSIRSRPSFLTCPAL